MDVLVRNLDGETVEKLKARAERHGRSLQAELKLILERAAGFDVSAFRAGAEALRRELAGRAQSDSADLVRDDRAR